MGTFVLICLISMVTERKTNAIAIGIMPGAEIDIGTIWDNPAFLTMPLFAYFRGI